MGRTRAKYLAFALGLAIVGAFLCGCQAFGGDPAGGQGASFETASVQYVVDGDTVDVLVAGEERRVRLIGIDCPESASHDESENTPEGEEAAAFTRSILPEGKVVYLQRDKTERDKYGRHLYYVWLEEPSDPRNGDEVLSRMLNARIVAAGYAQAKRYPPDTAYAEILEAAQQQAVEGGLGISRLWKV